MAYALRCPDCRKAFKWEPSQPDPRHCPLCQADMGEPPDDNVICLPAFISASTKANDKVYRDIEASSVVRMEKAAEAAGVDVSDMAAMKITDLRPTTHEGAIAAVPVTNAVTQQMDMLAAKGGNVGWQGSNGAEFAAGISTGAVTVNGVTTQNVEPRAGARTIERIQGMYGRR